MKMTVLVLVMTALGLGVAVAQPTPSMPAPAPRMAAPAPVAVMAAMSAPAPEAAMTVMTPVLKPAAMPAPMEVKADAPPATMEAAPAKAEKKWTADEIVGLVFKILGGLASLIFTILGGLGYMGWVKTKRGETLHKAFEMAFFAVEAISKKTSTTIDDKLAEFLKRVNSLLTEAGKAKLSPQEEAEAKTVAANMAAAEKLNG